MLAQPVDGHSGRGAIHGIGANVVGDESGRSLGMTGLSPGQQTQRGRDENPTALSRLPAVGSLRIQSRRQSCASLVPKSHNEHRESRTAW